MTQNIVATASRPLFGGAITVNLPTDYIDVRYVTVRCDCDA